MDQQPAHTQQHHHQQQCNSNTASSPSKQAAADVQAFPDHDASSSSSAAAEASSSTTAYGLKRQVTFAEDDAIAIVHHLQPPPSSIGDMSSCQDEAADHALLLPPNARGSNSSCWGRFKLAVKRLKRDTLALYYAVHDPRTPFLAKLLPWLVLAYALSPVDLIPDFIPVLGFLDDMLLLPLGLWLSCRLIPFEVMEDSRERAAAEPLLLHKNWAVATLVFALWCSGLLLLEHCLIEAYGSVQLQQQWQWVVLAGTGAAALLVFVVWAVLRARHEQRRREEAARWGALLMPYDSSDDDDDDDEDEEQG